MHTFMIESESRDMIRNYLHLVPREFRKYCEDNSTAIIAAAEVEPDGLVAAGLLIISVRKNEMIIRWLFVDPHYRSRGAGEKLLKYAFEMTRHNNTDRLTIHVPSLGEKYVYQSPMAGFFSNYYFEYIDTIKVNGLKVFILSAPNNGDELAELDAAKDTENEDEFQKSFDRFLEGLKIKETEYYKDLPDDADE